jgi:exonuclease 1
MGIQGLLPMLKSISSTVHVSKYSGRRIAIDAYGWLHKGAYSCSRELCEGTPTDKCGYLADFVLVLQSRQSVEACGMTLFAVSC